MAAPRPESERAEARPNPSAENVAIDGTDASTWPPTTLVVRGGQGKVQDLRDSLRQGGAFSVISRPGVEVDVLAASVRNNQIRTTTVKAVVASGGLLVSTFGANDPPNHCDLIGLTAERLDSILGEAVPNPVPQVRRWRGNR